MGGADSGRRPSLIIGLALFTVLGSLTWASMAEVDQISRAPGKVIPSGRVQIVQSADGGVVTEILAREGDRVRRGELLVRLDTVRATAAYLKSKGREAALRAEIARLEAELYERPLRFGPELDEYPELVQNQRSLYESRRRSLHDEIEALEATHRLILEELEMNEPLLETGDVSRAEVLRLQRQASEISGRIVTTRNRYLQELQTALAKAEEQLVAAEQERIQYKDQLDHTNLYAPADGIVKNVRFTTVGAVLRPGDEVLQIVPTDAELIVEAQVSPADIGFIRLGQPANVKFDAYDYTIYGTGVGEVSYISADTLTEQGPRGEVSYYRVHVTVDPTPLIERRPYEEIELQPGMTATVEIKTGENTVLSFITKPLTKTWSEALTQR